MYPSRKADFYFVGLGLLRAPLVTVFHDTVNFCFNSALEGMGTTVRDVIYDHLEKKRIPRAEISARFDDAVQVLMETFGTSARIIIYKTLSELYSEYSLRADFTYQDSLRDRFILLKDRVVADHLIPRRAQRGDWPPENQAAVPTIFQNPNSSMPRTHG